jgi:hypothetical protein
MDKRKTNQENAEQLNNPPGQDYLRNKVPPDEAELLQDPNKKTGNEPANDDNAGSDIEQNINKEIPKDQQTG